MADAKGVEEMTDGQRDSLLNEAQKKDLEKEKEKNLSAEEDPHQRAYYLAQIPLTEEKMAESNQILDDGLLHAGIILKDKLDDPGRKRTHVAATGKEERCIRTSR